MKWLPLRIAKIIKCHKHNEELYIGLEFQDLVLPNGTSFEKALTKLSLADDLHHVIKNQDAIKKSHLTTHDFDGFNSIVKKLLSFSPTFNREEVIFSYFRILNNAGEEFRLGSEFIRNKDDLVKPIDFIPLYEIEARTSVSLHLTFYSPVIGNRHHLLRFFETLTNGNSTSVDFSYGNRADIKSFVIKIQDSISERSGTLNIESLSHGTYFLRPKISFNISCSKDLWMRVLVLAFVMALLELMKDLSGCALLKPTAVFFQVVLSVWAINKFLPRA
ncbi:MAG: hypothetical protein EOP48_27540 [Sphingobacteriales bacterium]|nr:MAG: hypothetical protein EOP48_27540 [Sphingobacteriales bacterium]